MAIIERLAFADEAAWKSMLAGALGDLSYRAIFTRDFLDSLAAVDRAISMEPDTIWLYGNRAHALMFHDRVDDARALYLKYRGTANVVGTSSWEEIVLIDFAEFRKAGLAHPLMDEIEETFRKPN